MIRVENHRLLDELEDIRTGIMHYVFQFMWFNKTYCLEFNAAINRLDARIVNLESGIYYYVQLILDVTIISALRNKEVAPSSEADEIPTVS